MELGPEEDLPSSGLEGGIQETPGEACEGSEPVRVASRQEEREEQGRSAEEATHKNRSKRESRRMRELEQAQFSLELLKVRTTSAGGRLHEAPAPEGNVPDQENQRGQSPRGSPVSHGSLELLAAEDMESESQPAAPGESTHGGARDSDHSEKQPGQGEGPRATFYIASDQSPLHEPKFESPGKHSTDRRGSASRRPVVVLISMQKESPVEEQELLAARTHPGALEAQAASPNASGTPIAGLEVTSDVKEPREPPAWSSDVDPRLTLQPKDSGPCPPPKEAPSPVLDTKPPKAQKKSSSQTVIVNMVEKPTNTVFSPPRRKLPFSK